MISSIGSLSSSSSATVRVEKATSEFLMGPDWTMNIDICDTINTNQMLAKDVVKAVKKRLQHKNPKVQLLALTLLETMVKNCGDYVHFHIAERNILQDMVKIVKKRTDMHVRDKVLALIGSWHEAFGGSQGTYPQYFMAYEDLRRSGVEFPKRSPEAAPIFTPPVTHPISKRPQPGYGSLSSSSTRLDEAMAADDNFSLSNINSMRDVLDLLTDMLQAVDPNDRSGVKDEVIVDLVEQCRANQKKLMEVLATNRDEELLGQGLELNDDLQSVLARHDAIASGSPLPLPLPPQQATNAKAGGSEKLNSSPESAYVKVVPSVAASSNANDPSTALVPVESSIDDEDEEEEDDFALLARRHSKPLADAPHRNDTASSSEAPSSLVTSNALVPVTPSQVQTKDQDIIDLLSITLSATTMSTEQTPTSPIMHIDNSQPQGHMPPSTYPGGVTFSSETSYPVNPVPAVNNYVAPWAQPQPQPQFHSHLARPVNVSQFTSQPQLAQHQSVSRFQPQHQFLPEQQQLGQYQSPYVNRPVTRPPQQQYSSAYPPPPWASTPGYFSNPNPVSRPPPQTYSMPSRPIPAVSTPLQHESINGNTQINYSATAPNAGQKPAFIPSYRLFEDIDVFGNNTTDGRFKAMTGNASHSLSGSANQSMVGGRK